MKKQQFTALILPCVLMCSALELFPVHAEEEQGLHAGHFENYAQYENAAAAGRLSAANESSASEVAETLPEYFDLRLQGLVSSVKDQGSYGICWSFSAINSLENSLIARKPTIDLSEWHLAYYTYSQKFGFPLKANTDMEDVFSQGGNFYMLSPMLTGWMGPVSESAFPFNDYEILDPDAEWADMKAQAEYHVSDADVFSYHVEEENFPNQLEAVKQAIYQGHAMSMSYYNKSACYNSSANAFYFDQDEKTGGTYHAVAIVGWDDAFSADHFKTAPPGDGAWLVKNSWGADWGDYGYFWISYYDSSMLEFYYLGTESLEKHDTVYAYDDYGYWTAFSVRAQETSAYVANVFTAEKDTYLTSVMLCNAMPDEHYSIQIYLNPGTRPNSGTPAEAVSGSLAHSGYHTIDLDEPVSLHKGDKFSIVVKWSGEAGQHIVCEAYTKNTITRTDGSVSTDANMLTEEMIRRDFAEGESFYSTSGRTWYDIYQEDAVEESYTMSDGTQAETYAVLGNICVRGLTKDAGTVLFSEDFDSLPIGAEISLSSPGSSEIYYSINDEAYQLYTEPLIMPEEEIHISAYAVTDGLNGVICEKTYAIQLAQPSSILYIEDGKAKQYLQFEQTAGNRYETTCIPSQGAKKIELLPMTTGQIMLDNEEILYSGAVTRLDFEEKERLILHVSQDNMRASEYIINLTQPEFEAGDVNADGVINASDAADILVYASLAGAGKAADAYSKDWQSRGDYNYDGEVNALDAASVLKYAADSGVS